MDASRNIDGFCQEAEAEARLGLVGGSSLPTSNIQFGSIAYQLEDLLEKVVIGINHALLQKKNIDITEIAKDILTQNPHLRHRVINSDTLTGANIDSLESNDRFYYENNKNVWLFSLEELKHLIDKDTKDKADKDVINNPYTLEPFDNETIKSIKRRIQYNKDLLENPLTDSSSTSSINSHTPFPPSEISNSTNTSPVMGIFDGYHPIGNENVDNFSLREVEDTISCFTEEKIEEREGEEAEVEKAEEVEDKVEVNKIDEIEINHKMIEFLHRVSYLGCYPDINGFKALTWDNIVEFLQHFVHDWPTLLEVYQNDEGKKEKEELQRILKKDYNLVKKDYETIVNFFTKIVNHDDDNNNSRALLFTTEIASYLHQIEDRLASQDAADNSSENSDNLDGEDQEYENEEEEEEGEEGQIANNTNNPRRTRGTRPIRRNRAELQPPETYERMLARLRAQPDNETFAQQVRFIIEHIVEMNTYSLSNSVTSNSTFISSNDIPSNNSSNNSGNNTALNSGASSLVINETDDSASFFSASSYSDTSNALSDIQD